MKEKCNFRNCKNNAEYKESETVTMLTSHEDGAYRKVPQRETMRIKVCEMHSHLLALTDIENAENLEGRKIMGVGGCGDYEYYFEQEKSNFIILSDAHIDENQKEYLKKITEDSGLAFRTTKRNLHADLVDEMIDYNYKGIVVANNKVKPNYLAKMYHYAKKRKVEEKIYLTTEDGKLKSMWDMFNGDAKEYATELI